MAENLLSQIQDTLFFIKQRKTSLGIDDIMLSNDVVLQTLMNELGTFKKQYVEEKHVNQDGTPRAIKLRNLGKGPVYVTNVDGNKRISAKSKKDLIQKLYIYYSNGTDLEELKKNTSGYTVNDVFEMAFAQKKKEFGFTELADGTVSSKNTLQRIEQDYRRFITPKFGQKAIRTTSCDEVKSYCVDMLNHIHEETGEFLKQKAFNDHFKATLRFIWGYAEAHDLCKCDFISNPNKFKTSDFKKLLDARKPRAEEKVFKPLELERINEEVNERINTPEKFGICYVNGYMFRLSRWTGMRIAELCSLKWKDIDLEHGVIHVHSQQLVDRETGEYFYANWTKNEKGTPNGGRYIPIFDETREIILEYRDAFNKTGIKSEWVFANEDGSWIKVDSQYAQFLRRISSKCNCQMSNNHAIRIYFNSFVLIPAGVSLPNRARILGHTEEVNLSHYTFEEHDYVWTTYEKVTKYRRNAGLSARGD